MFSMIFLKWIRFKSKMHVMKTKILTLNRSPFLFNHLIPSSELSSLFQIFFMSVLLFSNVSFSFLQSSIFTTFKTTSLINWHAHPEASLWIQWDLPTSSERILFPSHFDLSLFACRPPLFHNVGMQIFSCLTIVDMHVVSLETSWMMRLDDGSPSQNRW